MAKGVNKVFLLGRLGKDPEIRTTQGGMIVASFTVATSDRVKGQDGQWTDKTEWHNLVAFQRTAEIIRDYCKKGKEVFIEGKIQTRSWDDKTSGEKKYRTEILVNELSLLGGGAGSGDGERSSGGYSSSRSAAPAPAYAGAQASAPDYADQQITDDDIPF
jgi:single-strand DNA-binding protein